MSNDYEVGWTLKVEEMTEAEVNGFILFLKGTLSDVKARKSELTGHSVTPSAIYNYENRLEWMLVPEVRDELTSYCFRLEIRSRTTRSASPRYLIACSKQF
jgi:hypothetical protein